MPTTNCAILLLLGAALAACQPSGKAKVKPPPAPIDVKVVVAAEHDVPKTVRITGSLRGDQESDLAADANGRVTRVLFDVGSAVKRGDILAKIDARTVSALAFEAGAQVDLVRARREQALRECERADRLLAARTITEAERDRLYDICRTSEIDVRAAESRSRQASQAFSNTTIRAPFDGVIVARSIEPGEYVRNDTLVARMTTVSRLRLIVEVPEPYFAMVPVGTTVKFDVAAHPGRQFSAVVDRRGAAVRNNTRDVLAEAAVDNDAGLLLPGMFAGVDVTLGTEKLPTVPSSAIVQRSGHPHVFVSREGIAEERAVAVGVPLSNGLIPIVRGVRAGESVIVDAGRDLINGSPVK